MATKQAVEIKGPVYLRLGRAPVSVLARREEFKIGKAAVLSDGGDMSIIACGHMVEKALAAAEELKRRGIKARS